MMPNSREVPRFIAVAYGNVCLHGLLCSSRCSWECSKEPINFRSPWTPVVMASEEVGRTSLRDYRMTPSSVAASVVGLGVLAAIAALL